MLRSPYVRLGLVVASCVGLAACTALLGTFDVDPSAQTDGGASSSSGTSGTSGTSGSSGPGIDGSADDAGDASITCDGGLTGCGAVCVDTTASEEHCGGCGHACGGGACTGGVCQPVIVYDGAGGKVAGVASDGKDVFFSVGTKLLACPATGCKAAAPRQLVDTTHYVATVAYLNGTVAFESAPAQATIRPALYACAPAGCAGLPASFASAGLTGYEPLMFTNGGTLTFNAQGQGVIPATCGAGACVTVTPATPRAASLFAASATHRYFIATGGALDLTRCAASGACTPEIVRSGDSTGFSAIAVEANALFFAQPGRPGFNEGKILRCNLAALPCPGNIPAIAVAQQSPRHLLANATGTFWVNEEDKKLQACAPGLCVGGPRTITTGTSVPTHLASDGSFLYWADGPKVWRVRP